MGNLVVDSERAGQTLLENDPNSKYPKCQVFDLSIESNDLSTLGVCDWHLSTFPVLLPTTGVCDQHRLGASLRLLLTVGECDKRLLAYLGLCSPLA